MLDLNSLQMFVCVVDSGSFRGAATELKLPRSTVSRRIAELEDSLGARLLERTTRSVRLTPAGAALYRHAAEGLRTIEEGRRSVDDLQATPRGQLRVTVPAGMAHSGLDELLVRYARLYPDVELAVDQTDRTVDLVGEQYDVAIRAGALPDSTLVARRLFEGRLRVVASPAYIAEHGSALRPDDLLAHNCLSFAKTPGPHAWHFERDGRAFEVRVSGSVNINSFAVLHGLARHGLGVIRLPEYIVAADVEAGVLVPLLDGWAPPAVPVHVVYPSARHLSPRVRAFAELVATDLKVNGAVRTTKPSD